MWNTSSFKAFTTMKLVDMSYDMIKQINEMLYIHEQSTFLRTCRTMQEMVTNIYIKSEEYCYVNVYIKENKVLVVPLSGCGGNRQFKKTQHHWDQTDDVIAQLTKNKIKKLTLRKCNLTVEYCRMISELIKMYPLKIDKCDILSSILPYKSISAFGNLLRIMQPRVININKLPNIGMAIHEIISLLDVQRLEYLSLFYWGHGQITDLQDYTVEDVANDSRFGYITWYSPWFAMEKYPERYTKRGLQDQVFHAEGLTHYRYPGATHRRRKNGFDIPMPCPVEYSVTPVLWNVIKRTAKWVNISGRMDGDLVRLEGGAIGDERWLSAFKIMKIPANTVGLVIGHGQKIQARTGCSFQMRPENDPRSGMQYCILQGGWTDRARDMINEVISRAGQQAGEVMQQQPHNQGKRC